MLLTLCPAPSPNWLLATLLSLGLQKKKKKSTYRRKDRLYAHSINTPEYMNVYNPTQVHIYAHKLSVHNSVSQASAIDTEQSSHK